MPTTRAVANLEEANTLLPGRSEILNHLGIAYDTVGRHDDALAVFEQAVALGCRNPAAASNLASAQQREEIRGAGGAPSAPASETGR